MQQPWREHRGEIQQRVVYGGARHPPHEHLSERAAAAMHKRAGHMHVRSVGELDLDEVRSAVVADAVKPGCGPARARGRLAGGQHCSDLALLPREGSGADQVDAGIRVLPPPCGEAPIHLSLCRAFFGDLGGGQEAAAATRDRCEDAGVKRLLIHAGRLARPSVGGKTLVLG